MLKSKSKPKKKTPLRKRSIEPSKKAVPSRVIMKRAFEGASKGKRTKNWRATNTSANTETLLGLSTLRARCRDLARNNGYAESALRVLAGNTAGTGIILKIESEKEAQASKMKKKWETWAETTECDADGLHDIYGLHALATRAMFESGEVLIRRRWRRSSDGLSLPMQIQVLEADHIDTLKNQTLPNGGIIVQGVEYSPIGQRVAYWLYPNHPGDSTFAPTLQSKRVPAEDIRHLFCVSRPGQVRGIPRGACVVISSRDLDDVQDSYINGAKVASCFTVFVTEGDTEDLSTEDGGEDEENDLPENVEPGMITKLSRGQTITSAAPPGAGGYRDFSEITLQKISAGYGVPYEAMTGDYGKATFSSSRMSWLNFDRDIEMTKWLTIIPRLCREPFAWFKQACEIEGISTDGATSVWTPPRRQMIDPLSETRAMRESVRAGFMSLYEAIRQLGYDPKEVLKEAAEAKKFLAELGLVLDSDPSKLTMGGMNQPESGDSKGEEK